MTKKIIDDALRIQMMTLVAHSEYNGSSAMPSSDSHRERIQN